MTHRFLFYSVDYNLLLLLFSLMFKLSQIWPVGAPLSSLLFIFTILFYIGVQLVNNAIVSGVQQSDSVIHTLLYVSSFQILLPYRLLRNIQQSSLCFTADPCLPFFPLASNQ